MEILDAVKAIVKRNSELSDKNAENFNVFTLLDVESDEVGLHSRFLVELLHPKGSHGQGVMFLKLFFAEIGLTDYVDINLSRAKVSIEEFIGPISKDYTTGGRIDIVIKNIPDKPEIIIENKIFAIDQPKQLHRYYNAYPKGKIIYLTLDGANPAEDSFYDNKPHDVLCISYQSTIVNWLEATRKAAQLPLILDSTISLYIKTLKKLTNQSVNSTISKEIMEVLTKNGENFKAAMEISNALFEAKKGLIRKFAETLKNEFSKSGDPEYFVDYDFNKVGGKDTTIDFVSRSGNLSLCLYFLSNQSDLIIGTLINPDQKNPELISIADKEMRNLGFNRIDCWPRWLWSSRQLKLNDYFNTIDGWSDLADEDFHLLQESIPQINQILKALKSMPRSGGNKK